MARKGISRETLVIGILLLFVPATLVGPAVGAPPALEFFLSVAAIVPLAALIGWATEALADRFGGSIGGLLNATFGNAPDLLVGIFGVQHGLIPLVKATLVGAIISNSALVMGLCYIAAGLKYGRPRFRREEAGHHSVLLMLTVAAVLFPSLGSFVPCQASDCGTLQTSVLDISVGISAVLLMSYCAYIGYAIFGYIRIGPRPPVKEKRVDPDGWPVWLSLALLGGSTVALIPITDTLTSSVGPVTGVLGWTEVFVGMVVVANAGNVAEAYAAIRLAVQRPADPSPEANVDSGLDLALGIASASSIQIAAFICPLVVFYSLFEHPMNLVFSPVEVGILALMVIIFTIIALDGESNWLEGVQLVALYLMAAIVFYWLPLSAFGS